MDGLLLGLSLGLGAGLAPGPLLALVIRTAARDGLNAGIRVALSPLITDVPIILVALLAARSAPERLLGAVTVVGGAFVVRLGVQALREPVQPATGSGGTAVARRSILWGAVTNALSPHPWVFWITVGVPVLAGSTVTAATLFLISFYLLLFGTKIVVAAAVVAGRERLLGGRGYAVLLRLAGLLLLVTGALLVVDGVRAVR